MSRKLGIWVLATVSALTMTAVAQGSKARSTRALAPGPATLTVDDDRQQCPDAGYIRIRDAIDKAHTGDTIVVCAGAYAEGPGTPGSTALPITKSLNIQGAGADLVTISPKRTGELRIAESSPDLRNGKGVIISAKGDPNAPI